MTTTSEQRREVTKMDVAQSSGVDGTLLTDEQAAAATLSSLIPYVISGTASSSSHQSSWPPAQGTVFATFPSNIVGLESSTATVSGHFSNNGLQKGDLVSEDPSIPIGSFVKSIIRKVPRELFLPHSHRI